MSAWIAFGSVIGLMPSRQAQYYRHLAALLARTVAQADSGAPQLPAHPLPDFTNRIAAIQGFLPPLQLAELRKEVEDLAAVERSYLPTHKKGGTIAYANLIELAPGVTRLYHSEALRRFVSRVVGEEVQPTPLNDQSSLSILIYDRPGDHIDWHYDHNFYRGRHFTVLLPVVNIGHGPDGLSHARLLAKIEKTVMEFATPPNTLVVFEGAQVLHKASPIAAGERRIVISMTYCADARATWLQAAARRIKDTAFFGVRALWT